MIDTPLILGECVSMPASKYDLSTLTGVLRLLFKKKGLVFIIFLGLFVPATFLKFYILGVSEVESLISPNGSINTKLTRQLMANNKDDLDLQSLLVQSLNDLSDDDPLAVYLFEQFGSEFVSYQNIKKFETKAKTDELGDVLLSKIKDNGTQSLRLKTKQWDQAEALLDKYILFVFGLLSEQFSERYSNYIQINWMKLFREEHLQLIKDIKSKKIELEIATVSKNKIVASSNGLAPKTKSMIERELKLLQENEKQLLDKNSNFIGKLTDLKKQVSVLLMTDGYTPVTVLRKAYGPVRLSQIRSFLLFIMIFIVAIVGAVTTVITMEGAKSLSEELREDS